MSAVPESTQALPLLIIWRSTTRHFAQRGRPDENKARKIWPARLLWTAQLEGDELVVYVILNYNRICSKELMFVLVYIKYLDWNISSRLVTFSQDPLVCCSSLAHLMLVVPGVVVHFGIQCRTEGCGGL